MHTNSVLGKMAPLSVAVAVALSSVATAEENDEANNNAFLFNQVVVTATKTENDLATAPASMSVITSDEIMSQPNTNLNDIVKQAVGVEGMKDGGRGGREMISIRGMDSGYTMIMINGRKLSSSNAIVRGNDFDLSTIPQDNIERIEIIRGPMSALYGSEALGGVINVITKLPDNEWRSSLSGDYSRPTGTNHGGGEYRIGLNTGGALVDDELFLNLSVSKTDRDAWTPYSADSSVDYDRTTVTALEDLNDISLSGGLNWLVNNNHTLDFDFTYSDEKRKAVNESSIETVNSDQHVKRNSIAITHGGDFNWGETQLRYSREDVEFGDMDYDLSQRDWITEINNVVDGSVSTDIKNHRLTFGGDIRHTSLDNTRDLVDSGKASLSQQALFIQDEWAMAEDWTLTFGTRMDHHENFGYEFSPRAYLVNTVTDNLTVKGGIGQAFKAPSMLQMSEEYIFASCRSTCYMQGNPDLKPETSTSYELSANYQETNWMVEATAYRNDVDNLIERDLDNQVGEHNGLPVYTYHNVNKARINGVELGGRIALTKTVLVKGDYAFTDAKDKTTGELLTNRPRQTVSARLDWTPVEKLTSFVSANYNGTQKINDDTDLKGYTTASIGMNYQFSESLRARAGITNIGNKKLSDEVNRLGYSIDPRTWYVGFTSTF